jgi:hypothetical protein
MAVSIMRSPEYRADCIDCLQAALRAYVGMERSGYRDARHQPERPADISIRDRDRGVQRPFQKCIAPVGVR